MADAKNTSSGDENAEIRSADSGDTINRKATIPTSLRAFGKCTLGAKNKYAGRIGMKAITTASSR